MIIKTTYPNLFHGCNFLCFLSMNYSWVWEQVVLHDCDNYHSLKLRTNTFDCDGWHVLKSQALGHLMYSTCYLKKCLLTSSSLQKFLWYSVIHQVFGNATSTSKCAGVSFFFTASSRSWAFFLISCCLLFCARRAAGYTWRKSFKTYLTTQ